MVETFRQPKAPTNAPNIPKVIQVGWYRLLTRLTPEKSGFGRGKPREYRDRIPFQQCQPETQFSVISRHVAAGL